MSKTVWLILGSWLAWGVPGRADSPWPHDPAYGLTRAAMDQPEQVDDDAQAAKWIRVPGPKTRGVFFFRKTIELADDPGSVMAYVGIGGKLSLWVNGHELKDETPLIPWAKRYIKPYDLTPYLQKGANLIALSGKGDAFAMLIDAIDVAGARQKIVTDSSWQGTWNPPGDGWQSSADFSSSDWAAAEEADAMGGPSVTHLCYWPERLLESPDLRQMLVPPAALLLQRTDAGPIDQADALVTGQGGPAVFHVPGNALATWRAGSGDKWFDRFRKEESLSPSVLVDFGREMNGRLRLTSASDEPMVVIVCLGECPGEAVNGSYLPIQRIYLPPHGQGATVLTGFRYANIFPMPLSGSTADPVSLALGPLVCEYIHDPVEYQGSFTCSDDLLNRIWAMSAYTIRLNMQSGELDGNKRDRGLDTGDMLPRIATDEHVFGENAITRKSLLEMGLDRYLKEPIVTIPSYTVFGIELALDDYRYTGDPGFIRDHADFFKGAFELMRRDLDARNMFGAKPGGEWPYVDWAPGLSTFKLTKDQVAGNEMVYSGGFAMLGQALDLIGDPDAAAQARQVADQVKAAAQTLWDPALGAFGPRHQVNALAIRYGVADPGQAKSIVANVLLAPFADALPDSPGDNAGGKQDRATPYFEYLIQDALLKTGHPDEVLKFIRSYWGEMIRRGATTTWEQFDPRDPATGDVRGGLGPDWNRAYLAYSYSESHGWGSGAADLLTQLVLGFSSQAPGETKVRLFPTLLDLTSAKGTLALHSGLLSVSYGQSPTTFSATVQTPAGCDGELGIPKRDWTHATFVRDGAAATPGRETADRWIFPLAPGASTTLQAQRQD